MTGMLPTGTLPFPTPTFDHVVVNARDRLDEAEATYRRLGFTLTPRGFHSLGSANHLAVFGTDYLELIALLDPNAARRDILEDPCGLNGLVFGTEDSSATYRALAAQGVPATPPNEFTRPVALPGGAADARFRTVHVQPARGRPGRLYFCHHYTRELVWRDEWRHHANGALGVVRAVVASDDPSVLGELFARMFGPHAVRPVPGGVALAVGVSRIEVLRHDAVAAQLGEALGAAEGRAHYMAALTLRTASLDMARAALGSGGVRAIEQPGRLLVPAAAATGCPIEFVA
ncbi:MAG: VOC family protein [Janthinobacterium lividum]